MFSRAKRARGAKLISPARKRWVNMPNLSPEPLLRGGTVFANLFDELCRPYGTPILTWPRFPNASALG